MAQKPETATAWESALRNLAGRDNFTFLETSLPGPGEDINYLFLDPVEIVEARSAEEVPGAFERIEKALQNGLHAAGIFSYELGYCLEPNLFTPPAPHALPLLSVGLFDAPVVFNANTGDLLSGAAPKPTNDAFLDASAEPHPPSSAWDFTLSESPDAYARNITQIKRLIEAGDTYQVNYTLRLNFQHNGDPLGLYLRLREKQKVAYAGMWRRDSQSCLSLSPELFFKLRDGVFETRPMKGTVRRGLGQAEDDTLRKFLGSDEKNLAENLMIVDLLRNDLGRVSLPGSVKVPALFDIEPYETLFQMTSTVTSTAEPGASLLRIFQSLFPSGSVTGAPKISSMKIIHSLESSPRGIYTGALGHIAPKMRSAVFNVAIRTIHLDEDRGEMGVGGGIVYDSEADSEWREALLKSNFFTGSLPDAPPPSFALIETILHTPGEGFFLIDYHLDRLAASATRFRIHCDRPAILASLESAVLQHSNRAAIENNQHASANSPASDESPAPLRVRLLLSLIGDTAIECFPLPPAPSAAIEPTFAICPQPVLSTNPFLRHKTTLRDFYNQQHALHAAAGRFDVVFINERGEITEGAITNIVANINGELLTPPASCGLLEGVYRRHLLETRKTREAIITPAGLAAASEIFLCNSVRGMIKAAFIAPSL